jgi:hypothetical protein
LSVLYNLMENNQVSLQVKTEIDKTISEMNLIAA